MRPAAPWGARLGDGTMKDLTVLLGRVGLALMFLLFGWAKLHDMAGTQAYMQSAGVPAGLYPLVVLAELGGGLAILTGTLTRIVALLLVLFALATAFLFHYPHMAADAGQAINFWKNISIAGGFLVLAAHGAGAWSVDGWWANRKR